MSKEEREVLAEVRELLEYAKTLGMREVPGPKDAPHLPPCAPGSLAQHAEAALQGEGCGLTSSPEEQGRALEALRQQEIGNCTRCRLASGRRNIVFGVGNPSARLAFVGEGPGADEDAQGVPFVGRAGQLLTRIIEAMGLKRDEVFICNIVKCRPPNNRNPLPDEVQACIPFLVRQMEIIRPSAIVCLGSVAVQNLLGTEEKISRLRGRFTSWRGIPVMPTYHPAFLLRNPNMKKPVWEDMQEVMRLLNLPLPPQKQAKK